MEELKADTKTAEVLGRKLTAEEKQRRGAEMFFKLSEILSTAEWETTGYCYACDTFCPFKPPLEPGDLWLEAAGVTCLAWSNMRKGTACQQGWLHESTLPRLTWLYWLRQFGAHLAMIECVRKMDMQLAD